MKIEIVYKSKKNTRKLAEAMGNALNVIPKQLNRKTKLEEADILFLGFGIYAGDVHEDVKNFIESLNPEKIKKIVLFSTSGRGIEQIEKVKEKIKECGLNLEKDTYNCAGQAFLFINRNHPTLQEINGAAEFAKKFV